MRSLFATLFFTLCLTSTYAQLPHGIKDPGTAYQKKCAKCISALRSQPPEVSFGIQMDEDNNLYFVISHANYLSYFFSSGSDGFVIDVVEKSDWDCSSDKDLSQQAFNGTALNPVYYKYLSKNLQVTPDGMGVVALGPLPKNLVGKDVEFNMVFLEKNNYCFYHKFYNIQAFRWDLLDMGLYMDSLTYKSDLDTTAAKQTTLLINSKTLNFEVPFEKGKADFTKENIKPLYDSLNLSDFNILKIKIHAYASVEGSKARNIELQENRANAIVQALQSYQEPSIETEVTASENWVEFLNDIEGTKHAGLKDLSKEEIKKKLASGSVMTDLDTILAKHRKALITVELQKRSSYTTLTDEEIVKVFHKKLKGDELDEANQIQNEIMSRIAGELSPKSLLEDVEIPLKSQYGTLLQNRYAFEYFEDNADLLVAYNQFKKLDDLTDDNPKVKYNLCALKFKVWLMGEDVDPDKFLKEIKRLGSLGIDSELVKRMIVNHNIIMASYHMAQGNFTAKDKALKYIYRNYKYVPLKASDYLSLAQYFTSYAKYEWAKDVIKPKLKEISVDEDLLFYYLNLTLTDEDEIKRSDYNLIMMNAISKNNIRFCKIFDAIPNGGVSFQLLDNKILKAVYCENCN